jgi:hypothetical protein
MPDIYLDGFAKLTGVSLPFLRHGLRDELPPASLAQLRADHPELWKLVSRARQMPRPRASVVVLPAPPDGEDRQVLQR